MLHPELTINGKKPVGELEPCFKLERFACEIGDLWLEVEYSREGAAFIGWGDAYSDDVFYFDNGSGNSEPVDLCVNVCPEERMMCYDQAAVREIVLYFCETGQRHSGYQWIEDLR